AGYWHSLALRSDGSIIAWGRNNCGQATTPDGNNYIAVSAGHSHNLALRSDGSIVAWGLNHYGQAIPPPGDDFVAIAAGSHHSLAIRREPPIEAEMRFTPQALNCKNKGKWVKAHFFLPADLTVEEVDSNSPGYIYSLGIESDYMDVFVGEDGLVRVDMAFDRAAFCDALTDSGSIEITVKGFLTNSQYFYGTDTIKIIDNIFEYLAFLSSQWLGADCSKLDWCQGADIDQDSVVNLYDYATIVEQWMEEE
ncbi:MAG: hypothetical protein GWN67_03145, partial [Phycisphaerae bacterium]|nr:hypothetical protein [Phycisphaerae bacterium]NIT56832.1 hypothetical protein [Fodinibius sp.]NIS51156.1 hypothetical protein [Phycisphaerae bacterium]NIU55413.1 hypothetical protein [Phycisphaerae bacterium]NIV11768.1 hypothetical protein [Fodinibius sp.]